MGHTVKNIYTFGVKNPLTEGKFGFLHLAKGTFTPPVKQKTEFALCEGIFYTKSVNILYSRVFYAQKIVGKFELHKRILKVLEKPKMLMPISLLTD